MAIRHFGNYQGAPEYRDRKAQDLLGAGWQPLYREIDWGYLWQLLANDPWQLTHKTLDVVSDLADAVSRSDSRFGYKSTTPLCISDGIASLPSI